MDRRAALKSAAALALPALGSATADARIPRRRAALQSVAAVPHGTGRAIVAQATPLASPGPDRLIGYVFNAKSKDVTLFDPITREVLATRPLGAVVRWLSNEQRFWDGQHVWTYDFPDNAVQALAIDPHAVTVARTLPTGGAGPAHSLMLTPDRKQAWVNVAGGNYLAVLDVASGEVIDEIATGAFP